MSNTSSKDAAINQNPQHEYYEMTKNEFLEPIKDSYVKQISQMSMVDLDDGYNPGPTKPDGSVNFACHCVGHLVASPCGHEFREAAICQKAHKAEDFEAGACGDEFVRFMQCVMKTECFKSNNNDDD